MPRTVTVHLDQPIQAVKVKLADSADGREQSPPGQLDRQQDLDSERAALVQARRTLELGAAKFDDLQAEFFREAEEQLVELAVDIARKVLSQQIEADSYRIDPIVHEALSSVQACRDVVVHLNPRDMDHCELAKEAEGSSSSSKVRFVADAAVHKADCIVETSQGVVESTVAGQLDEIANVLKETE